MPQFGIAKLVNITSISLWFLLVIYLELMGSINQFRTGGHHIVSIRLVKSGAITSGMHRSGLEIGDFLVLHLLHSTRWLDPDKECLAAFFGWPGDIVLADDQVFMPFFWCSTVTLTGAVWPLRPRRGAATGKALKEPSGVREASEGSVWICSVEHFCLTASFFWGGHFWFFLVLTSNVFQITNVWFSMPGMMIYVVLSGGETNVCRSDQF